MTTKQFIAHRPMDVPLVIEHTEEVLSPVAKLAATCIEKWGMVAGAPNGEDSAGRQKLRLLGPEELVSRAFRCAESFMAEAEARGHITRGVSIEEYQRAIELWTPERVRRQLQTETSDDHQS